MTDTLTAEPTAPTTQPRRIAAWVCPLIGAGAALVGLLPWLITGIRLPLQNLWGESTLPGDMPLALLPFSQYALTLLFGLLVTGAAVGGLVARVLRARMPRLGALWVWLGVLVVQVVATVQTAVVVGDSLQRRSESAFYLGAVLSVTILSIGLGILAFWLIAYAPRAGALIGFTGSAIAAGVWLNSLIHPFGTLAPDWLLIVLPWTQWVPPILVGVAIAWTGVNTVGRVIAALFSLALLWFAPALMTGLGAAAGTRVLANDIPEMIAYGREVFLMALFMPELALRPIIVAVVVAVVGLIIRAVIVRRNSPVEPAATA